MAPVFSLPLPSGSTRWRCTRCGNLTRFDVTRSTRTRDFVHQDLAGEPSIEEQEKLADTIEEIRCRWCDGVDTVELVPRPDGAAGDAGPDGSDSVRAPGR